MRKILFYACCILFAQTVTASSGVSFHPAPLKYAKAPPHFSSYGEYLQYNRKKLFEGIDSANAFYKREIEKAEYTLTDYLPLTGGSLSGELDINYSNARITISSGSDGLTIGMWDGVNARFESSSRPLYFTTYSGTINFGISGGTTLSIGSTNVGIGTTSPVSALDVTGTNKLYVNPNYDANTVEMSTVNSSNTAIKNLFINSPGGKTFFGGNVGIGTTSPAYKLDVNGTVNFSGIVTSSVDTGPFLNAIAGTTGQQYFNIGNTSGWLAIGIESTSGGTFASGSSGSAALLTQYYNKPMQFATNNTVRMSIDSSGNVGIGTKTPSEKLAVNGNVRAKKIIVTQTSWSDYVFNKDYKLRTLQQVESFIKENNHLPEIPSTKEVEEKGMSVGDNQALLLKKIEELTLYVIDLQKQVTIQAKEIKQLKQKNNL